MSKKIRQTGLLFFLFLAICILISCNGNKKKNDILNNAGISIVNNITGGLKAGFSSVVITPEVPDRWTDINGDAEYNPKDGDTFTDGNGNGVFDPVWIAGFGNRRAANGIHDDIWARTMVIDDGQTRIAIVSLDAIGFMNNHVNDVRKMIPAEAGITYLIVSSTHTHEAPDLLGLWGKSYTRSGVNSEYMEFVKLMIVKSVVMAAESLRNVTLEVSEDPTGAVPLLRDSRIPEVLDPGLRIIKFVGKAEGKTLGTIVSWGNHPETLWGKNLLITSDFPHYLRENIEKGIYSGDSLVAEGTGGTAIYLTGAVGGLMTTSPGITISDPFTGVEFKDPTFEKARAQGDRLAILVFNAMKNPALILDSAAISLVVRHINIPLSNRLFKLARILGVLDRGTPGLKNISTELAVFSIGPLSFVTLPGEVYPEIINGGIESPEGNDFNMVQVEVPSVREMMPGKIKFIIGLGNDEIGYIIPKSQWDAKAPHAYGRTKAQYGEENSMGSETAPVLHKNLKEMLLELR